MTPLALQDIYKILYQLYIVQLTTIHKIEDIQLYKIIDIYCIA